ncbi:MAG TPA: hypothetical protein VGB09_00470 [Candidatus Binatia bacterium]
MAKNGVPSAEPVAFGAKRARLACVRSCFIMTRHVENSFTLEQ